MCDFEIDYHKWDSTDVYVSQSFQRNKKALYFEGDESIRTQLKTLAQMCHEV